MAATVRVANPDRDSDVSPSPRPDRAPVPALDSSSPATSRKRVNWALVRARCLQILWAVGIKCALGITYFVWISRGIRHAFADAATKLYKLPFPYFSELEHYEATYRLDTAHVAAMVLLVLSWLAWHFLLRLKVSHELKEKFEDWSWNVSYVRPFVLVTAVIIVVGDGLLFYASFNHAAFGDSKFSVGALLASLVYMTVLVLVNFVSLYLAKCVEHARKEPQS